MPTSALEYLWRTGVGAVAEVTSLFIARLRRLKNFCVISISNATRQHIGLKVINVRMLEWASVQHTRFSPESSW